MPSLTSHLSSCKRGWFVSVFLLVFFLAWDSMGCLSDGDTTSGTREEMLLRFFQFSFMTRNFEDRNNE